MTAAAATRSVRSASAGRRSPLVPGQHGAWAFLVLPVALAVTLTGWFALLVPLTAAWVAAYPTSWALTGRLAAPRPERFTRPLLAWSPVVLLAGAPVLLLRPWLVWVLTGYLCLWAVNLRFARQRRERDLANDLVLVVECAAMVPVCVGVAAGTRGWALPVSDAVTSETVVMTVVCIAALVGSVLHVKSLIRERRDPRYARASRWTSLVSIAVVAVVAALTGLGPLQVVLVSVPFALLAARAFLVGPGVRPAKLGLVELGGMLLVLAPFLIL